MAYTTHILVLANRTVGTPTLVDALKQRATAGPVAFTLLVPTAHADRETSRARAEAAVALLDAGGIVAECRLGPEDPVIAIEEEYDNARYDEIIVATLEQGSSRWLAAGLPARVRRLTDAVVHHVAVPPREAAPPAAASHPGARESVLEGMLGLLHVDTNTSGHPYA